MNYSHGLHNYAIPSLVNDRDNSQNRHEMQLKSIFISAQFDPRSSVTPKCHKYIHQTPLVSNCKHWEKNNDRK